MAVKYKRGTDGYFQARVWDGTYTSSGKKHYIRLRSKKSSRDLELKVTEVNRKREQREGVVRSNETFMPYEKAAVFKADFETQDRIFVYLIYGCGLRRSEALALTIFDFNLSDHTVTISKAHEFTQGTPTQKEPKTDHGYRTVPIPDRIFGAIKSYVNSLKASSKTYLFINSDGDPIDKNAYDRMWHRIIKQMQAVSDQKITGLTAHIFRHNYCTELCYQIPAISIKHIAHLLGDTKQMVMNVYNHIVMEKEDAALAINAAL